MLFVVGSLRSTKVFGAPPNPPSTITQETITALNLTAGSVAALDVRAQIGKPFTVVVPVGGESLTLQLKPYSVRSTAYELKIQLADGSLQSVEPGPVRTLQGTVAGIDGSVVAASLMDDGLYARIDFPGGATYWVEPLGLKVAGARPDEYAVYRGDDVIASGGACTCLAPPLGVVMDQSGTGGVAAGGGLYFAELAVDVDFEFYQRFAGDPDPVAAVEAKINSIINALNTQQYEPQTAIRHVIGTFIIRTAEPDPYPRPCAGGSNDGNPCTQSSDCPGGSCPMVGAEVLLNQFRSEWTSAQSGVQRDIAQLFTGKDMAGSTIGIAWVGSVCSRTFGYSVVQDICCNNFACETDLSAHELGHNWGAPHCSCPLNTMNPSLQCANVFSAASVNAIINHRDTRSCLDVGDELVRIVISAPTGTIAEGTTAQFTATAIFAFGPDQDITNDVTWSSVPATAGVIDAGGLFTAFNVDGDSCVTVSAVYPFGGVIHERSNIVLVEDLDGPLMVVQSDPPDGAIDARQPSRPDGTLPVGYRSVDIKLSGDICFLTRFDFTATQAGGVLGGPFIQSVEAVDARTVRVHLNRDLEPQTWTTVTHIGSGSSVTVGYLPGDVSGDGIVTSDDLLVLIDALNNPAVVLPLRSSDLDRSGSLSPADLLRAVDLIIGADAFDPWNLRSLP